MTGLYGRYVPVKHEVDGAPRSSLRHAEELQWKDDLAQEEYDAKEQARLKELYIKWYGPDSPRIDELSEVAGGESNYSHKWATNEELVERDGISFGESSPEGRFSPTLHSIAQQVNIEIPVSKEFKVEWEKGSGKEPVLYFA